MFVAALKNMKKFWSAHNPDGWEGLQPGSDGVFENRIAKENELVSTTFVISSILFVLTVFMVGTPMLSDAVQSSDLLLNEVAKNVLTRDNVLILNVSLTPLFTGLLIYAVALWSRVSLLKTPMSKESCRAMLHLSSAHEEVEDYRRKVIAAGREFTEAEFEGLTFFCKQKERLEMQNTSEASCKKLYSISE